MNVSHRHASRALPAFPAWLVLPCLVIGACSSTPPQRPSPALPAPPVLGPAPAPPTPPGTTRPPDAVLLSMPDPVPVAERLSSRGNPAFYEVYGTRYVVQRQAHGYVERGVASWYGPDFHEKSTSSGEAYDMYGLTAAHKTLPLPCYVEVTNLGNGRRVTVRVNDRGPFKANRIIDLSYTAALKLGMLRDGTALVEVRALDPGGTLPPPAAPAAVYAQAGAFASQDNARQLKDRLAASGFTGVTVYQASRQGSPLYRVRVGPIADAATFDALVQRLEAEGVHHAWLSAPGEAEQALP